MLVSRVMATVGAVGVAFYLRFLLALWKDSKREVIGYWARIGSGANEEEAAKLHDRAPSVTRAA